MGKPSEQLISWLSRLVKRESRGGRLGDLQGFRGDVWGILGCLDRRLECLKRSMAIGPLMIGKTGDLQGPRGLRGVFRGPRGFLKAY